MLTHLGDMAEVKGWALSIGRDKPFNQGSASFIYLYEVLPSEPLFLH